MGISASNNQKEETMNVYEHVTDRITELLEQGTIPWRKPWKCSGGPRNLVSKKDYRGINQFLLNCSPYSSPYWLTYKQCSEKGGHVRKGEKSTVVVFWKWLDRKDDETSELASPGSPTGKIPFLRYYNVFSLDQCEGIEHPKEPEIENPFTPIEQAEQIIENMQCKPVIKYGGNRACYSPQLDYVQLPPKEAFKSPAEFYSTAFHELAHATGHVNRLGRTGVTEPTYFGSHDYSQEELVAEFGASMLCAVSSIEQSTIENNAAYIQGWLKVLKNDKKLLVLAAAQGQKSADYILGKEREED
jgi:antirestriction protein ArdC